MKVLLPCTVLAMALFGASALAHADDTDHWVAHLGVHDVHPQSGNGQLAGMNASVQSSIRPTASIEYLLTPNWSFEALVAAPFSHTILLDGQRAAHTRQLPPVLGVNYHFRTDKTVQPFVGLGANFTYFYDEKGRSLLNGAHVKIDNSWGVAAHAGVDFKLSPKWLITADVRWINIETAVKVDGAKVGNAVVNPLVYGLSIGYRF